MDNLCRMEKRNPLQTDIKFLKGVGEYRARLLNKLGIETIEHLFEYFPRDYINRTNESRIRNLRFDHHFSIVGRIMAVEKRTTAAKKSHLNVMITDGEDALMLTWFSFGKWFSKQFEIGKQIWVSGIVTEFRNQPQIVHPEIEILESEESDQFWHNRRVLPVYKLTEGISTNIMRKLILNAMQLYYDFITETLPAYILSAYHFAERKTAIKEIHLGEDLSKIAAAKKRFAFEELLFLQIMLARSRYHHQKKQNGHFFQLKKTYTTQLKNSLPFVLTAAQKKVIREIVGDMNSSRQMNRLLQGDVGSGKTIVTVFAMLLAIENGYQSVLMAPTEILAEQHYQNISQLLPPEIKIALLKGGTSASKTKIKEKIKSGEINIIIGTHALIQKDVEFCNAGFIAIDEQHRFGVEQRAELAKKNNYPDLLYLSATPIPRSLALTIYGDLDVSIIDELPPYRKSIRTLWHNSEKSTLVYEEMKQYLKKGRQAYVVCPLIEESEKIDLLDAQTLYDNLKNKVFPEFRVALLHGRMKTAEKDAIMDDFKKRNFDILVSTTVIEVGIDVPNATVMVIQHAERFGLSQLHQLRGRVGRGADQSLCYLLVYPPISEEGRERLQTMVETNDGFLIAEKDLELRGPGEFFGTAQSGLPVFRHANIISDQQLLKEARIWAEKIISEDFNLEKNENKIFGDVYFTRYYNREKLFDF
jgi:ATP-dependent DNA helicase RecG